MAEWVEELERLSALRAAGHLSEQEYQAAKKRVLSTQSPTANEPFYVARAAEEQAQTSQLDHVQADEDSVVTWRKPVTIIVVLLSILFVAYLLANTASLPIVGTVDKSVSFGNWTRAEDEIDGVEGQLLFGTDSKDGKALVMACHKGRAAVHVEVVSQGMPLETPVIATLRLDSDPPFQQTFVVPLNATSMKPGTGSQDDSLSFMRRLEGHDKLVIRITEMMGMTITDKDLIFDISGASSAVAELQNQCGNGEEKQEPGRPLANQSRGESNLISYQPEVTVSSNDTYQHNEGQLEPVTVVEDGSSAPIQWTDIEVGHNVDLSQNFYVCLFDDPGDTLQRMMSLRETTTRRRFAADRRCNFNTFSPGSTFKVKRIAKRFCLDPIKDTADATQASDDPSRRSNLITLCGREGQQFYIDRENNVEQAILWLSQDEDY